MILREPCLPPGWYPRQKAAVEEFLKPFSERAGMEAAAALAPHAGWYYSGVTAAKAVSALDPKAETVAVIGGHLPEGMPVLIAGEDGVKTPLGVMEIDAELRSEFEKNVSYKPDRDRDNTVEVLLPMVHYFFPKARLLWLRFPADPLSYDAGITLGKAAKALGRKIAVLASTDLTHYGANYGFSPKGLGAASLEWVKKVNDAAFIAAVLEGDPRLVLERAGRDFSSCSAGAVLGALGFTAGKGSESRRLLDYRTSADADDSPSVPSSFVGYAAVSFGNK